MTYMLLGSKIQEEKWLDISLMNLGWGLVLKVAGNEESSEILKTGE